MSIKVKSTAENLSAQSTANTKKPVTKMGFSSSTGCSDHRK